MTLAKLAAIIGIVTGSMTVIGGIGYAWVKADQAGKAYVHKVVGPSLNEFSAELKSFKGTQDNIQSNQNDILNKLNQLLERESTERLKQCIKIKQAANQPIDPCLTQ